MKDYKELMSGTEDYVTGLYRSAKKDHMLYHNIDHTKKVVTHTFEIASHYEISERELAVLDIAAWFHDVGHLYTNPAQHEQRSVEIMKAFLDHKAEPGFINEVTELILATRPVTEPRGMLQEILRDADTYHYGTSEFTKTNKIIKKENNVRGLTAMTKDWKNYTVDVLRSHKFYTSYCQELLAAGKEKNLSRAVNKMNQTKDKGAGSHSFMNGTDNDDGKKASKPDSFVTKGIQTSLRLTSENHLKLSEMADSKANILISVNAIIISVILSVLLRKIESEPHLTIPTFIFLAFSLATIVVSIIATTPKITKGDFSREDVLEKRTNLLFFGNFHNRSLEEYTWAMSTMLKDPDYLYGSIVQDIYFLGVVLGKKYRLLRKAYFLFMIGIVISVFAFITAILLYKPDKSAIIVTGGSPF